LFVFFLNRVNPPLSRELIDPPVHESMLTYVEKQ